jgi:alpha-mannosidase
MQRHAEYTRTRIRQLADRMREKIYAQHRPVDSLVVSGPVDRITFTEAQGLKKWRKAKVGDQFGPMWATYWFRAQVTIPKEWKGKRTDLLWVSHSEATLWIDGKTAQGLNHEPMSWDKSTRSDAILAKRARGGESIAFQVEMACNRVFGDPGNALPWNRNAVSPFFFERCDIALFDQDAWDLYYDFFTLVELENEQSKGLDPTWAGELLSKLNDVANVYDGDNRTTWKQAREILKPLYERQNASATHELSAIGHAHIDTAWLWPLAETYRKCERTFSSQLAYMEEYPEFKFACSQAYQYSILKQNNPQLYARIKKAVKEGRFVPVGGSWIEPDCNIPSGEALVRQFLHGQRFFEQEFGIRCKEFWNPDVFGYNGQLPQIMRLAGITRFLTQKLSWNRFTQPLYHTFDWEGIDGSKVLAHFPPANTYNALATIPQLRENVRNYKDHDRSTQSLMLFGYGDGGGGPTKQMLETLRRAKDLQGVPRTTIRNSNDFFTRLEKDVVDRPVVVGELYFELHRGTYTSQAAVKRGNRKSEFLLHDLEFLFAWLDQLVEEDVYPAEELDSLWKIVLLNQFHDILPGSSITQVYTDSARHYEIVQNASEDLRNAALQAYAKIFSENGDKGVTPINTTSFDRHEVIQLPDASYAMAAATGYGIGEIVEPEDEVSLLQNGKTIQLENASLRATFSKTGALTSLIEKSTGREAMAGPGNAFQIYDDRPTAWDAWDVDPYHLETERDCGPSRTAKVVTNDPLRKEIAFEYTVGVGSTIRQVVRLDAASPKLEFHCTVDWRENHKMLKVAFPVNVRAMNATYEMQFGIVERPTHFNTPADLARYEVPGHKFADLSEHGFGVALLSESKYGWSTRDNVLRLSLLRATTHPDPTADRCVHQFAYAIMPHKDNWREAGVVAEGYKFNCPMLLAPGVLKPAELVSVDNPNVVIDTVKRAEDSGAMILRLYECHGARGTANLTLNVPHKSVQIANIMEEPIEAVKAANGRIPINFTPFQVITLLIKR